MFGGINYSEAENYLTGLQTRRTLIVNGSPTVTALHMAHELEKAVNAIKGRDTEALVALSAIKNSETASNYINWLLACKPLNY